jgi:ApeA N-terminal domain 1
MTEQDEIEGRWWIRGPKENAEFGTLVCDREGLSLTVKIPQNLSVDAAMQQPFSDGGEFSVPEELLGRDAHNKPVTLFGCFALPTTSTGLVSYKISALAAVQGLALDSWGQECIHAASLDVD